jgi:hypothetical protein
MSNNQYIIDNIEEFAESSRRLVFNHFDKPSPELNADPYSLFPTLSKQEETELNTILSLEETKTIILSLAKTQTHKTTKNKRYLIDDKIFVSILEALNTRLVSNILINLTNKGLIESGYDDKLDDFVFWIKNENENKNEEES